MSEVIAESASGEQVEMHERVGDVHVRVGSGASMAEFERIYGSAFMGSIFGRPIIQVERKRPESLPDRPSRTVLVREEFEDLDLAQERIELAVMAESELGYRRLRQEMKLPSPLQRKLAELDIDTFSPESVKAYKDQMQAYAQAKEQLRAFETKSWEATAVWGATKLKNYGDPIPEYVLRKCRQIKQAIPDAKFEVVSLTLDPDPFMVVHLGRDTEYFEVWDEPTFAG